MVARQLAVGVRATRNRDGPAQHTPRLRRLHRSRVSPRGPDCVGPRPDQRPAGRQARDDILARVHVARHLDDPRLEVHGGRPVWAAEPGHRAAALGRRRPVRRVQRARHHLGASDERRHDREHGHAADARVQEYGYGAGGGCPGVRGWHMARDAQGDAACDGAGYYDCLRAEPGADVPVVRDGAHPRDADFVFRVLDQDSPVPAPFRSSQLRRSDRAGEHHPRVHRRDHSPTALADHPQAVHHSHRQLQGRSGRSGPLAARCVRGDRRPPVRDAGRAGRRS